MSGSNESLAVNQMDLPEVQDVVEADQYHEHQAIGSMAIRADNAEKNTNKPPVKLPNLIPDKLSPKNQEWLQNIHDSDRSRTRKNATARAMIGKNTKARGK